MALNSFIAVRAWTIHSYRAVALSCKSETNHKPCVCLYVLPAGKVSAASVAARVIGHKAVISREIDVTFDNIRAHASVDDSNAMHSPLPQSELGAQTSMEAMQECVLALLHAHTHGPNE